MKISEQKYNELIMNRAAEKRIIRDCMVEILDYCNFSCEHCYVHNTYGARLGCDDFKRIVDELRELGCVKLLITGGEPLLHPDFREMYAYAVRKGLSVTLFTNGALLDDETVNVLREYRPELIELSLYGASPETFDAYAGVPGAFAQVESAIDKLRQIGVDLKLKTVMTKKLIKELDGIQELCRKHGIEFRCDGFIVPKVDGDASLREGQCCPPEEIAAYDCGRKGFVSGMKNKLKAGKYAGSDKLYPCSAGRNSVFIDAKQNLCICVFARHISVNLGGGMSIKEGQSRLLRLLEEKRDLRPGDQCYRCEKKDLCRYCPGQFLLQNGDEFKPIEWNCRYAQFVYDRCMEAGTGEE